MWRAIPLLFFAHRTLVKGASVLQTESLAVTDQPPLGAQELNSMYNANISGPDDNGKWPDMLPCDKWGPSCGGLGIHGMDVDMQSHTLGVLEAVPDDCDTHCHWTCSTRPSFCPATPSPISFSYLRKDLMFSNVTSGPITYRALDVYSAYNPIVGPLGILSRPQDLIPLCIFPLDGNTDARHYCGCAGPSGRYDSSCPDWQRTKQQVNWCDNLSPREYWLGNTLFGGQMNFSPRSQFLNGTIAPQINYWTQYAPCALTPEKGMQLFQRTIREAVHGGWGVENMTSAVNGTCLGVPPDGADPYTPLAKPYCLNMINQVMKERPGSNPVTLLGVPLLYPTTADHDQRFTAWNEIQVQTWDGVEFAKAPILAFYYLKMGDDDPADEHRWICQLYARADEFFDKAQTRVPVVALLNNVLVEKPASLPSFVEPFADVPRPTDC